MPKLRKGFPPPPDGWALVVDILDGYDELMKQAIHAPTSDKRRVESSWGVLQISHQRTRELYDMVKKGVITPELFDYCASMGFVDGALADKWRQAGYEVLCCTQCVASKNFLNSGACVCRVPSAKRHAGAIQCSHCGCTGCASGDRHTQKGKTDSATTPGDTETS
jgi:bud site selection protein 31